MRKNIVARIFAFSVMSLVKILSHLLYRFDVTWLSEKQLKELNQVKLVVLLNHTSLFEVLFIRLATFRYIWKIATYMTVPVADITIKRPIVGRFFRYFVPGVVPISRKRDDTWFAFLEQINSDSIIGILPEGRMRRLDGKDKFGKPMSVRTGVADIIERLQTGNILFVYSGGLHHVQAPGQPMPRLFKKIKTHMEMISVTEYKDALSNECPKTTKAAFVRDIQERLEQLTPYCEQQPYNQSAE